jgi:hypothetical protein
VALSEELDQVRGEIKRCVLNGAASAGGEAAVRPPTAGPKPGATRKAKQTRSVKRSSKAKPPSRSGDRAAVLARSAADDEQAIAIIKGQPGVRTGEIARRMKAKNTTCIERLQRLKQKGLVSGGRSEGWIAAA